MRRDGYGTCHARYLWFVPKKGSIFLCFRDDDYKHHNSVATPRMSEVLHDRGCYMLPSGPLMRLTGGLVPFLSMYRRVICTSLSCEVRERIIAHRTIAGLHAGLSYVL